MARPLPQQPAEADASEEPKLEVVPDPAGLDEPVEVEEKDPYDNVAAVTSDPLKLYVRQIVPCAPADQGRRIGLPVHVAEQRRKVLRARRILAQKLNRDPVIPEIAKESGFPAERVQELLELIEDPVSLETPVGDGESIYSDLIEDTKSDQPDAATAKLLRSRELAGALRRLNPRQP